jgi:hypothetical protein
MPFTMSARVGGRRMPSGCRVPGGRCMPQQGACCAPLDGPVPDERPDAPTVTPRPRPGAGGGRPSCSANVGGGEPNPAHPVTADGRARVGRPDVRMPHPPPRVAVVCAVLHQPDPRPPITATAAAWLTRPMHRGGAGIACSVAHAACHATRSTQRRRMHVVGACDGATAAKVAAVRFGHPTGWAFWPRQAS